MGHSKNKRKSASLLDTVRTVVYAVLIALVVRTFAYEPFNIPSGSMIPTLLVGDYLFVSKFSYGYSRYSLPFGLPLFPGRILFHPPRRGDVVVFKVPTDNSTDFIKRLVGLPGDSIQVKHAILYINGKPAPRQRIADYLPRDGSEALVPVPQYIETLPDGVRHRIIQFSDNGPLDNTPIYHVPPGRYFMMGDNRDNSEDSRVGFSGSYPPQSCFANRADALCYVPAENLVGRADIIFFSTNGEAQLWQFWKWPFAIRYDRLFHIIH
jgi:signal peptidase I